MLSFKLYPVFICREKLSDEQLRCLESMRIRMLTSATDFFCQWIEDGFYDFYDVDIIFKCPLSCGDKSCFQQLEEHPQSINNSLYLIISHKWRDSDG